MRLLAALPAGVSSAQKNCQACQSHLCAGEKQRCEHQGIFHDIQQHIAPPHNRRLRARLKQDFELVPGARFLGEIIPALIWQICSRPGFPLAGS